MRDMKVVGMKLKNGIVAFSFPFAVLHFPHCSVVGIVPAWAIYPFPALSALGLVLTVFICRARVLRDYESRGRAYFAKRHMFCDDHTVAAHGGTVCTSAGVR